MYFLLSTLNIYLPLIRYTNVYELQHVVVISSNYVVSFCGAKAPRRLDDSYDIYV
jgi:hypothetical protein